jgi:hypothetical protein
MRDAIDRLRRLVISAVQVVAGTVLLSVFLVYWHWTSIKNLAFRESLVVQAQKIRALACPLETKEALLDEIEALMDDLHEGRTIGVLRWMEFRQAIDAMLKDGITNDERRLIERECERLEQELRRPRMRVRHDEAM